MDNIQAYFLPSEVARLVLGYLQDIGCKLTYKCFMKECTDLVEYSTLLKQGMTYPTTIMGLSLISIINEYASCKLQENQSCQMSTSAASLWKQFDSVTKNLKKFSRNKVRQTESQTSRTRKLNQKKDRNVGCKKSNSSDMDANAKDTSDEEWLSDNTSVIHHNIHEVSDNSVELDHSININTSTKSSPSKSKTICRLNTPTSCGVKSPISKRGKAKHSATKVKLTNKNIEFGDIEKSETVQIQSFKRTTRSSMKKLSVNSTVLVINEDKKNLQDRSVHSTEKTLNTSQLTDDMVDSTELTTSVGEASFLDKTFEVVKLRENCACDMNNENDKLVNLRENGLCDMEMNDNGYLDSQMNTAVTHAFSTVPNSETVTACNNLQSQEMDEAIHNIPVPIHTPQKTFRPINVDENSNVKTPVKSFIQLYSDQQHRSPRRKRQPPKRRQDNNITVMGGLSPDVSTCSQFPPPGPDVDENTISDYPDILERLLGDTKLHEKLAENINKKLVPIKQTKDTIENIVLEEKIQPPIDETLTITEDKNSNGSNENVHSISDVIKGIADMTEHDPSFESLFSLFMSAKESSVHDEVDQMICQSTNQLSSTSHDQTSHDQPNHFNTSTEPTDVNGQNNSNHSNQHLLQEQQVYSTQQSVISVSSMNQNNNSNIAVTTLQTHIQDNLSVNSSSGCSSIVQHNNYFQTSADIAGRSVVHSVNHPDCLPVSSNQILQPVTALSQLDNKTNPIPHVAPPVYNIINLNSPAMSVISIASPDPYMVPTPERIPNSQGKLRKPKRITPTPLCGNEVLPDIGKIASPHKPLNLIPETSENKDYLALVCSPQVSSFQIQGHHIANSQPCDVVNAQTDVVNVQTDVNAQTDVVNAQTDVVNAQTDVVNAQTDVVSAQTVVNAQTDVVNAQTDVVNAQTDVDTNTSLSNSLQYIGTDYPQLTQTEQENASVCDISTSPGGKNIQFLNKRPFSTAKEENSSCILSPITPVNEKSQSVSSTPYSMVSISKNALSKPPTNLSPIQEFKKPNMLTRSSKKSTPKTQQSPRTENTVLTSYSLSPLKTDASVIHGSINQTAFTAVPLGKLSRRFCHVRNLDFGSDSEIIHSTDVLEMHPKNKIQMKKVVYSNLSTVATSKSTESGKKETVIKVNTDNGVKVRPLKPRHFSNNNNNNKPSVISNQLTISQVDIKKTQDLVKSAKDQNNTKLLSKLPQVILSRVDQVSCSSKTKVKTNDKKIKKKPSAKDKILNINNSAKIELSCISPKSSPMKVTKSQSSRRTKNATPKKIRPLPPSFKVQAPADVIDLLDADTKEFNEHLKYVNTDKQVDQSMASNISLPLHKESRTSDHDETKEAAEVLASLAMPTLPVYCTPLSQSVDQDSGGKRKADESSNESWMSVNSLGTGPKKKRRKKSLDLKDINIDLLLSKIKYKK